MIKAFIFFYNMYKKLFFVKRKDWIMQKIWININSPFVSDFVRFDCACCCAIYISSSLEARLSNTVEKDNNFL